MNRLKHCACLRRSRLARLTGWHPGSAGQWWLACRVVYSDRYVCLSSVCRFYVLLSVFACSLCVLSQVAITTSQVFADVAKRYLHEVAAVRQQGSASTSGSLGSRVNQVQRRSQSFFREEVPQDPAGQVSPISHTTRSLCK